MTGMASVPPGLSIASVRAGFARGVGVARPAVRLWLGQAAPGEYRSPFPARLRIGRAAIVALALAWLAAGFHGLNATSGIVHTVGHDTAPSVSSAEAIRTGLAAANADYALAMLSNEGADGAFLSAMRLHLRAVRSAVVEAAGNVTYGDEERGPIGTVLQGLGDYEQAVGRSIASAGDARRDLAFAANDVLHWTVLPAAVTLERVNAGHLAGAYADYLGRWPVWWIVAAGLVLCAGLVAVQVDMARTARRLVNPGLSVATLSIASVSVLVVLRLFAAQSDLRVAKADAFDSVYALSTAAAITADAATAQAFFLFADPASARRSRYAADYGSLVRRLLDMDPARVEQIMKNTSVTPDSAGYIGEELHNVTFPGERDAALALVGAWRRSVEANDALRADDAHGQHALAVRSATQNAPGTARGAFANVDDALRKVLSINQDAFASSIASAEGDDAPLGVALVAGFVLAIAAAWFGIGRRLDDYRF